MILIYGMCMLVLITSGVSYLLLKHYGYKKTGFFVSFAIAFIVIIPVLYLIFESEIYSKNDVREDLKNAGVVLNDDFEIKENDIIGLSDYYQFTKIKISDTDRDKIIRLIKNAKNFKTLAEIQYHDKGTLRNTKNIRFIWHYNVTDEYIIETYERKQEHIPMELILSVNEHSNVLDLNVTRD